MGWTRKEEQTLIKLWKWVRYMTDFHTKISFDMLFFDIEKYKNDYHILEIQEWLSYLIKQNKEKHQFPTKCDTFLLNAFTLLI